MSVKTEHKLYKKMKPEWEKCLVFATSKKAVHEESETFLPPMSEQDQDEYDIYKSRAPVLMLSQRAGTAMVGMATRKEAIISNREPIEGFLSSVDADKNSFENYYRILFQRFLHTGRSATLTDYTQVAPGTTKAQAEKMGARPRFTYYTELQIINWREERINGENVLTKVVLKESVVEDGDSEFEWEEVYRYRVLDLEKINKSFRYRQRVFNEQEELVETIYPKKDNKFLNRIPIEIHGGVTPGNIPLNAITDINVNHYQLGADEMWGLRLAALPTPYVFGIDPEDKNFPRHSGPGMVIGSEEKDVKTGFREFSGNGLAAVASKLQKFEDQAAQMAVTMTTEKSGSATESAINYANSTSTLSGVVALLNGELNVCLTEAVSWSGENSDEIKLRLNKDFMPAGMDANLLLALLKSWMSGGISYETYYNNLARGEVTDPQKTAEEEREDIDSDLPASLIGED